METPGFCKAPQLKLPSAQDRILTSPFLGKPVNKRHLNRRLASVPKIGRKSYLITSCIMSKGPPLNSVLADVHEDFVVIIFITVIWSWNILSISLRKPSSLFSVSSGAVLNADIWGTSILETQSRPQDCCVDHIRRWSWNSAFPSH